MPTVSSMTAVPAYAPGDAVYLVTAGGLSRKLVSLRVSTIAAMTALAVPTNGMSVEVTEAGRGGFFVFDTSVTAAGNGGTTFSADDATTGSWVRRYSGAVNVRWFDADPSGVADSTAEIQAAIDSLGTRGGVVFFPAGIYSINAPLYVGQFVTLQGEGGGVGVRYDKGSIIQKTTATVGTGSNTSPVGGYTTSYAVNAVIIVTHPNNEYSYGCNIRDLGIESAQRGDNAAAAEYGIYAPYLSNSTFSRVSVYRTRVGIYHKIAWMCEMNSVRVNCNTVTAAAAAAGVGTAGGWATTSLGWWFEYPGTSASTSYHWHDCWVRDAHFGYSLSAVRYSSMTTCGADNLSECAYRILLNSSVTLTGCGSENVHISDGNAIILASGAATFANVIGFDASNHKGASTGSPYYLRVADGARMNLKGCRFDALATAGNAFNVGITDGARLFSESTLMPSGGSTFVSYSGDGFQLANNDAAGVPVLAKANDVSLFRRSPLAIEQQFLTSKAIDGAGTAIATFTAAATGSHNFATAKVTLWWTDETFPNAVGRQEAHIILYREGSNYYQSIALPVDMRAGNSTTGNPTLTLGRASDVWTLTMTPADGACTARDIELEFYTTSSQMSAALTA